MKQGAIPNPYDLHLQRFQGWLAATNELLTTNWSNEQASAAGIARVEDILRATGPLPQLLSNPQMPSTEAGILDEAKSVQAFLQAGLSHMRELRPLAEHILRPIERRLIEPKSPFVPEDLLVLTLLAMQEIGTSEPKNFVVHEHREMRLMRATVDPASLRASYGAIAQKITAKKIGADHIVIAMQDEPRASASVNVNPGETLERLSLCSDDIRVFETRRLSAQSELDHNRSEEKSYDRYKQSYDTESRLPKGERSPQISNWEATIAVGLALGDYYRTRTQTLFTHFPGLK